MNLSTLEIIELGILTLTTLYHAIASHRENQQPFPGQITTTDRSRIHWLEKGDGETTIVIDHSLGGVEGYLLIDRLSTLGRVVIFDRPGYGRSSSSWQPRTSKQNNLELQSLLHTAQIQPPYILIGDSFGSYNMRLFAHSYPDRVIGLVMTDGLHESQMLSLPLRLKIFKIFLAISFFFVSFGAALCIVRICGLLGIFEIIKPELKCFDSDRLNQVKKSFYSASHWFTMAREITSLDTSGRQLRIASDLGRLPVINIKAATFLRIPLPKICWGWLMNSADRARDQIHLDLAKVSTNSQQLLAAKSSHFVWIDRPDVMVAAVAKVIEMGHGEK
jgi:pimeloyl-ACP methyl ester carboxylesterase